MTIQLSPEQERVIQEAIRNGVVHSVDEFIDAAIAMLRQPKDQTATCSIFFPDFALSSS